MVLILASRPESLPLSVAQYVPEGGEISRLHGGTCHRNRKDFSGVDRESQAECHAARMVFNNGEWAKTEEGQAQDRDFSERLWAVQNTVIFPFRIKFIRCRLASADSSSFLFSF